MSGKCPGVWLRVGARHKNRNVKTKRRWKEESREDSLGEKDKQGREMWKIPFTAW